MEILIGVSLLTMNACVQRTIFCSSNDNVQKWQLVTDFLFNGELNIIVDAIQMAMELFNVALIHDDKRVVDIAFPETHIVWKGGNSLLLDVFHHDICNNWGQTGSHWYSGNLFVRTFL